MRRVWTELCIMQYRLKEEGRGLALAYGFLDTWRKKTSGDGGQELCVVSYSPVIYLKVFAGVYTVLFFYNAVKYQTTKENFFCKPQQNNEERGWQTSKVIWQCPKLYLVF